MILPPDLPHLLLLQSDYSAASKAELGWCPGSALPASQGGSREEKLWGEICHTQLTGMQEVPPPLGFVHQVCEQHNCTPTMRQL